MRLTPAAHPCDDELRQQALERGDWIVPHHTGQYRAHAARRPYRDLSARSTLLRDRCEAPEARAGAGSGGAAIGNAALGRDAYGVRTGSIVIVPRSDPCSRERPGARATLLAGEAVEHQM